MVQLKIWFSYYQPNYSVFLVNYIIYRVNVRNLSIHFRYRLHTHIQYVYNVFIYVMMCKSKE